METATMSPKVLMEITGNSDNFSTPEQDQGALETATKTALLLAPKSQRISQQWLPQPGSQLPIVKSKVDVKDDDSNSNEDGKYLILPGNQSSNVAKHVLKITKITKKCPPPAPAAVCPRAEKTLHKVEERSFPNKIQTHGNPNQNRSNLKQCSKIPSRTESVTTNTIHPTSGGHKDRMTPPAQPSPAQPSPPPPSQRVIPPQKVIPPPQKVKKKVTATATKLPVPQKPPEKAKHYDPIQVKSYMEMKREVGRMKERKEQEERKEEADRKQKQLQELEHKRKDLIAKSRHSPKKIESKDDQCLSLATKNYRARKAKSPSAAKIPPPTRVPQPLLRDANAKGRFRRDPDAKKDSPGPSFSPNHMEGMPRTRVDSEAEVKTTMLIQEFQNIVQRECSKITTHSYQARKSCSTTVDVGVETTTSLYESEPVRGPSRSKSHEQFRRFQEERRVREPSTTELRQVQEAAATRIQSAYRGYRRRKLWRHVTEAAFQRPTRRNSFYHRPKSNPSTESVRRRLPLLSPAHSHSPDGVSSPVPLRPTSGGVKERSAFGVPLDCSPYIPPPPAQLGGVPSSTELNDFPLYPISVPSRASLGGGGGRRSSNRFDEPFPKEAIKQLARQSPALGISPALSDHVLSFRDVVSSPAPVQVNMAFIPGISELLHPAVPTFSMVLREKVRLLEEMRQTSAARKSGMADDLTPVKRRSAQPPPPPSDTQTYYDSDSTQHASIVLSGAKYASACSSTDVTITDDYIGPDEEAMQSAYNLRRSARVSLENVENLPRDDDGEGLDDDNNSTIPSYVTFNTTATSTITGLDDLRNRDTKGTGGVKEPLETFRREVDETNRELKAHAARVSNQLKREKIKEMRLRPAPAATADPRGGMEKKVDELQDQVATMDANMRSSLAKLNSTDVVTPGAVTTPQQPRTDNPDFAGMLEFAKCQAESLKATAQIQQWVADLQRSSKLDKEESRHRETVNIAAAVFAAVEEAKKLSQPPPLSAPPPPQHRPPVVHVHAQAVQTTDSLLQNESLPNYSSDGFLDATSEECQLNEEEEISDKVQSLVEESRHSSRRTKSEQALPKVKFQTEKSPSSRSSVTSTCRDSARSSKSTTSLSPIGPPHRPLSSPMKSENRVMVTFADVLREVQLLSLLKTETKPEVMAVGSKEVSISSVQEESKEEIAVSAESMTVEMEASKKSSGRELFSDEEFEVASTTSEESRSHSVVTGKLPPEDPSKVVHKSLSQEVSLAVAEESKLESIISEGLEDVVAVGSNVESHDISQSSAGDGSKSPVEKNTLDQTIDSVDEESGRVSPTSKSLSSILPEGATVSDHKSAVKEDTPPLDASPDIHESKEPVTSVDFESVSSSVSPSAPPEDVKDVAEISAVTTIENVEKNTLDESIAESEVEEFSYQSDFISNEASSPSPVFPGDEVLILDALDRDEAAEGEASGDEENELEEENEHEEDELESGIGGERKLGDVEIPEPGSESQKSSIELEKNTLDESIESEPLEEDVQLLSSDSENSGLGAESVTPKSVPRDDALISPDVNPINEEEPFKGDLEKSSGDEVPAFEKIPLESVSSSSQLLPQDASIPGVIVEDIGETKRSETSKVVVVGKGATAPEVVATTAAQAPSPTEDMLLDMMELAEYREKIGFPVRKPWRKWSTRERDIADHVLVGETLDENRSWIDIDSEIAEVTENLVETMSRRAAHETMSSIAKVLKL